MSRLAAFWNEFWESVKWTGDLPEKAKKMGEQAAILLLLFGYTVQWSEWAAWLRPWSLYLLVPVGLWLWWRVAVAWDRSRGPVIKCGDPAFSLILVGWGLE